jgi:phosphonoacetaldehyde hydrolase
MVKAVIFDWAGTTVDYGCFAPLDVFVEVFKNKGIEITNEEARAPMGMMKWDHIKALCKMERINKKWRETFGTIPEDAEVNELYKDFEPMLLEILPNYAEPIPGTLKLIDTLREQGIKIGSTTGYTSKMMEIVAREAKIRGYAPDCLVTSSDVPAGRPYPYMCYLNAIKLQVFPLTNIIKVGDTLSDIREGVNANMWSVGVLKGGSELGLSKEEVENMQPEELDKLMASTRQRYYEAGAHYVIDTIGDLENILPEIDERSEQGESPSGKK